MIRFAMTPLTPAVAQKIEALFAPESREAAGRMIAERCGADLPLSTHMGPDPSGFDRIRFAVLKLSQDLERLRREIDGAHFASIPRSLAAGFNNAILAPTNPVDSPRALRTKRARLGGRRSMLSRGQ